MLDVDIRPLGSTGIYALRFRTEHIAASTMMRFQEFYESPKFKNQIFTHEEFEDWYATKYGSFSYYTDWSGFNVPIEVVYAVAAKFPWLSRKERSLVEYITELEGALYLIAYSGDAGDLVHEVAHGLYHVDTGYRVAMDQLIRQAPKGAMHRELKNLGYDISVYSDECQAYLVSGLRDLGIKKPCVALKSASKEARAFFNLRLAKTHGLYLDPKQPHGFRQ